MINPNEALNENELKIYHDLIAQCGFNKVGEKTTICVATLKNGMEFVGQSQPVDADAYDFELGAIHALKNLINKQLSDIWAYEFHNRNDN